MDEPQEGQGGPALDRGQDETRVSARVDLEAMRRDLAAVQEERRRADEREALLRGELQHRIRNILAVTRSVFARTVASGGSLEDVADHFRGRLDALARYQSARASNPQGGTDIETIVREELHSFQFGDDERIEIDGALVTIDHDSAQLIALAIHELVTNSLKFGVLSQSPIGARLRIHWTAAADSLTIEWIESGVPILAPAPMRQGFGREFIEQGLPYQIGASTAFELRPGGVYCRISLARPAAA